MKKRSGKGYVYFLPDRLLFLFWGDKMAISSSEY